MSAGRAAAPVLSSIRWLLLSIIGWEVIQLLRDTGPDYPSSWPIGVFDILLLSIVPGLTAFAFIRLYLAVVQSGFGSLNTYTLTSSPWSWLFWIGLAVALVGQGTHITADTINDLVPEVVRRGEFGSTVEFLDESLGHWLLGAGFFTVTLVILALGQGAAYRARGGERWLLALGSVVTYGGAVLMIGVEGGQLVPAILGSGVLVGMALWALPPSEITRDPVSLLVVPGTAAAGLALLAWGLVVGGQPGWPW